MSSKNIRAAVLVFCAGLALRLPFFWNMAERPESLMRPDSATYLIPARSLLDQHSFSSQAGPEISRTPLYPIFLAAHLQLWDNPMGPAASQIVLDAGTAGLVSLAAIALTGSTAAGALGLLYALDPVAAVHAPLILSEPLFTFLLTLCVLILLRMGETVRPAPVALAGLCLGAATMVRPLSYYLWIPWALALAWSWRERFRKWALVFAVAATLLPAAWCGRNWAVTGHFEFSTITGVNALLWEASGVKAAVDKTDLATARDDLMAQVSREHPEGFGDDFELSHARTKLALKFIFAHPRALLKFQMVTTAKTLLGPGLDEVAKGLLPGRPLPSEESLIYAIGGSGTAALLKERPQLWLALVTTGLVLFLSYGLGALGAWTLWRRRLVPQAAVLIPPIAFMLALAGGGWSYYRFRLPLMPLLAILGAVSWERAGKTKKSAGRI